jgi:plasmid stability protein
MPHANQQPRRIGVAQVFLAPADHARLMLLAASHERSAAAEIRWAIRQWIDRHEQTAVTAAEQG